APTATSAACDHARQSQIGGVTETDMPLGDLKVGCKLRAPAGQYKPRLTIRRPNDADVPPTGSLAPPRPQRLQHRFLGSKARSIPLFPHVVAPSRKRVRCACDTSLVVPLAMLRNLRSDTRDLNHVNAMTDDPHAQYGKPNPRHGASPAVLSTAKHIIYSHS